MSNVIPFPKRAASRGFCTSCGYSITVPSAAAWPEACPNCHAAPVVLSSWWKPEFLVTDGAGGVIWP